MAQTQTGRINEVRPGCQYALLVLDNGGVAIIKAIQKDLPAKVDRFTPTSLVEFDPDKTEQTARTRTSASQWKPFKLTVVQVYERNSLQVLTKYSSLCGSSKTEQKPAETPARQPMTSF